jgi:hypothetical protein
MMKTQIKGTDQMTFVKQGKSGFDEEDESKKNINDFMKNLGLNLNA